MAPKSVISSTLSAARRFPWPFRGPRPAGSPLRRHELSALDALVHSPPEETLGEPKLDAALAFTSKLALTLLSYGLPVYRLEEALFRLSSTLGFEATFYATPTGIILSYGNGRLRRSRILKAFPGDVDLERLAALHSLVGRVERQELSCSEANRRIDAILSQKSRYGRGSIMFARILVGMAAATLLGGGTFDIALAGLLGALVGVISEVSYFWLGLGRLLPAAAALIAAFVSLLAEAWGLPVVSATVTLASLMTLLPGLTLTIAMLELATGNLVSGTSRMAGAMVPFLQMGFGVVMGRALAESMPPWQGLLLQAPAPLPLWLPGLAPFVAALGFGLLLRIRPRDSVWVLLSCTVALLGSRFGNELFRPVVDAALGSFGVGIVSHIYARWTDRPSTVLLLPGIMMLVPGSLGYLSMTSMMEQQTLGAVQGAFDVLMIATALSSGVLLATLAMPPKKSL